MAQNSLKVGDDDKGETSAARVGRQIRDLRRTRGLTLADLAAQMGRSVGYLSQIERGVSPVNITALQSVAQVLRVSINFFFSQEAEADPSERDVIVRRTGRRRLDLNESALREELLSPSLNANIQLMLTTFAPGGMTGDEPRKRKAEEAGYIISGILELDSDGKVYRLEAGDSFTLQPGGTHKCWNPSESYGADTVVVWVLSPPSY